MKYTLILLLFAVIFALSAFYIKPIFKFFKIDKKENSDTKYVVIKLILLSLTAACCIFAITFLN